ncbi:hypothetical protein PG989_011818 [Apiospora arundinis]
MSPKDQEPMPPIAVVGISCRLPGGANCPDELWQFLDKGGEAWSPVPPERFNEAAFHHPSADDPNGSSHHRGGHFIDADVRDFDASFFRISPQQAAAMDPQQRFLLEMSYEALESAGWSREHVAGSDTSVYTAMFTADYERNLYKEPLDLPVYYTTGTERSILSNRISHHFDLHGPSACQGLRAGESGAALVAAANLTLGPDQHVGMSNLHLVGASGRCHPFDRRGTGYGRGEGLVVLALKRLDDALRDRDPIRAVIRGTAVNQDGYTPQGITYPNGAAQAALIRTAYARCGGGLRPQDVAYVEAHGTGTVAGDTEELSALADVFASSSSSSSSSNTPRSLPLYVGSIKGNIGHTENTSGLASLVKASLILDHEQIPPVAGFADPKPGLPLDKMRIPTEMTPFPISAGITPTVSINSFGFGGTNAHVILQKGPRPPPLQRINDDDDSSPRLFVFSAHSESSLKMMMRAHLDWLAKEPDLLSLADLSYTLCHRRSRLNWRFGCVAQDRESLMQKLQRGLENGGAVGGANPSSGFRPRTSDPYVIFVFTGQGAQNPSPRLSAMLKELGAEWDLAEELQRDAPETRLNTAALAQPATTAIQIALVDRLRAQGIRPRVVVGHSSGEIAAAYATGRLSHRAAVGIAYHRGCCAAAASSSSLLPRGAMMAVGLGEQGVAPYLKNLACGKVGVACVNSPGNVTLSGDSDAVDEVAGRLAADESGVFHRRLMVDTAYHSHHMQVVAEEYLGRLGRLPVDESCGDTAQEDDAIAFISSVSGRLKTDCFNSAYWTANLVSQVRFCDAIQTLVNYRVSESSGRDALFIEIGPHNALSGPVRQTITEPDAPRLDFNYYSVLQRKVDAVSSTLSLASSLFERGVKFDMNHVTSLTRGLKTANVYTNLPAYPWDHSDKHWYESRVSRQYRTRPDPYHDLLGVRVADSTSIEPRWRHMVCLNTLPWLAHHVVDGLVVFPGSGYLCMATEAIRQIFRERHSSSPQQRLETIVLRNVSFHRALVVPSPPRRVEMQLSLDPQSAKSLAFAFRVTACTDGHWYEHCSGFVEAHLADGLDSAAITKPSQTVSTNSYQSSDDGRTALDPRELYAELADVGNMYGPSFTGIKSFSMTSDSVQAKSTVQVPDIASLMPAAHQAPHLIHPSTLDILLHTALPLVGRRLGRGSVMPTHIEELVMSATDAIPQDPGSILTAFTTLNSSRLRTSHADLAVTSGDIPLLNMYDIEMRSLGSTPTDSTGLLDAEGICYELDWKPDPLFLSAASVETSHTKFEDVLHFICFKNAAISVLELGSGNEDLSLTFIDAAAARGGRLASYDSVDTAYQHAAMVQEKLESDSVKCSTLNSGVEELNSVLQPHSYDVILASDPSMLAWASTLIKPNGTILAHLGGGDKVYDTWCIAAQGATLSIQLQLSWRNDTEKTPILVARPGNDGREKLTAKCHMLTHSKEQPTVDWVNSLALELQSLCPEFTAGSIDAYSAKADDHDDDTCFLVVDDQAQPILSDPRCFDAVAALLNQPARVVWVSPDGPMSMHQITGVARTAHAENYKLRLTTIHAPAERLASQQLQDLVVGCMHILMDPREDGEAYREREYWMRGDGTVLIPRLHPSRDLNCAVNNTDTGVHDSSSHIEQRIFTDPDCPLVLATDTGMTKADLSVQDHTLEIPLAVDEVEIEIETFALSKQTLVGGLCEYGGVISQVGTAVKDFAPGDRVMAVSSTLAASRIRVSQAAAGRVSHDVPSTYAAMLFSLMAASHALRKLADLPPTATVLLLLNALSPQGRAAIAVARFMGIRAIVTAIGSSQADELVKHLGIPRDDIWVSRPSLYRQPWEDMCPDGLDAILLAGDATIPTKALSRLKSFGCVVAISPFSGLVTFQNANLPSNVTIYHCDIMELLRCRPEYTASLIKQTSEALPHLRMDGLTLCTRDVSRIADAIRMVESGAKPQVVVTARSDSKVNALVLRKDDDKDGMCGNGGGWDRDDVSYVVAGGLGDLGRRLLLLMARRGAKHLVTLSRSLPSRRDKDDLQASLEAAQPGCRLYCVACDLTSKSSVQQAAETLQHDHGVPPVRGVIHSAAILQDRPLNSMTYNDFRLVSQVKVDGTLLLERAFGSPSLDFFLMLSSAANIVGTGGQANYNAGNAVQDALAQARRRRAGNCRYISLNIGWIEDAVHTTDNDARTSSLGRTGLRTIQSDELSRFFDYALGASSLSGARRPQLTQAIIGFDSVSLSHATSHSSNVNSPMFCHVRPADSGAAVPGVSSEKTTKTEPTATAFKQVLESGDNEAAVDYITAAICGQLAKLISVDVSRVNAGQSSMLELGLDSLVAIELRNWLMRTFDAPLQSSEIMDDQTIRVLGAKVVSRSRLCNEKPLTNGVNDHNEPRPELVSTTNSTSSQVDEGVESSVTSAADETPCLPPLPTPSLHEALRMFEDSRRAVDSSEEQAITSKHVQSLTEGIGPSLQKMVENDELTSSGSMIADGYERQIYLERREPLQDYSEFTVGHPLDAPPHSQARRAAIVTVAAAEFAHRLAASQVPADTLHGMPMSGEARDWLFWSTRRPGAEVDRMERHVSSKSHSVVVLRRGHVFELELPEQHVHLQVSGLEAAFEEVLSLSEEQVPSLCSLTAGDRKSWFLARSELETDPENAKILHAIDTAMFVVCLDDESPMTSGERHTQFLLGGQEHPFTNRWLDKPTHFAVTANGLSAGIFEHTKIDGLDVRTLHQHIHSWSPTPAVLQRVEEIQAECQKSYGYIDHRYFTAKQLSPDRLRASRTSPHATAHLASLLAVYLVDKDIRPAWEIVTLGTWAGGRIDWVQTVSPAFDAAARGYSQAMATAARGHGYVRHLYALLDAFTRSQPSFQSCNGNNDTYDDYKNECEHKDMPSLFRTHAWNSTRRGGPNQGLKIGFMPDGEDTDDHPGAWDEGGFLMDGDDGVYLHCGIRGHGITFAVSARPKYADAVCRALDRASSLISILLEEELSDGLRIRQ